MNKIKLVIFIFSLLLIVRGAIEAKYTFSSDQFCKNSKLSQFYLKLNPID